MTPAFVLHRRPYQNTSLLLECFVAGSGRLPLVAKGAARSKLKAELQPFQPLAIDWRGRGEVRTLTAAETTDKPLALHGKRLYCGLYLNELLTRLLPREERHDGLLEAYWKSLVTLVHVEDIDWQLRLFELRLLDELGYGLQLSSTANGDAIISERRYLYTPDAGFTPADPGNSGVSGATLHALHNGAWNTRMERREARDLMRTVLDHHLGHRPIRSRELFH